METKPGIYTTEFWISLFTGVFMFLNTVGAYELIPENWSALALAVIGGLYSVSRGIAKTGSDPDPAVPANTNLFSIGSTKPE